MKKMHMTLISFLACLFGLVAQVQAQDRMQENPPVDVRPILHGSVVLAWAGSTIYADPYGGAQAYADQPGPDIVLISHTHDDHMDLETLPAVVSRDTVLIVPQSVMNELPADLAARARIVGNNEQIEEQGFTITGFPMYNMPGQGREVRHQPGVGNGYIIERDGYRVYIAGDTADTPDMRALRDIDMAFIPMNLPYTMSIDRAADAVVEFAPRRIYPYHYRGENGLADVEGFRAMVEANSSDIEVILLDWYPDR